MKSELKLKDDLSNQADLKSLPARQDIQKLIDQLNKQNNTLVKMNFKSIEIIKLQNERLNRITVNITKLKKRLINTWAKTWAQKNEAGDHLAKTENNL